MIKDKIQLLSLIFNDRLLKSDAIICLEGDGKVRAIESARLFKKKWARWVVVSGGFIGLGTDGFLASKLKRVLLDAGVSEKRIIVEEKSQNTKEQAEEVMKIVKKRKWKRIILVASHFHQPRAFLTFLKVLEKSKSKLEIINAPVRDLSWFEESPWKESRLNLLEKEFQKIDSYRRKGDLASFSSAVTYLKFLAQRHK